MCSIVATRTHGYIVPRTIVWSFLYIVLVWFARSPKYDSRKPFIFYHHELLDLFLKAISVSFPFLFSKCIRISLHYYPSSVRHRHLCRIISRTIVSKVSVASLVFLKIQMSHTHAQLLSCHFIVFGLEATDIYKENYVIRYMCKTIWEKKFYVRNTSKNGSDIFCWTGIDAMVADVLTKSITGYKYKKFKDYLMDIHQTKEIRLLLRVTWAQLTHTRILYSHEQIIRCIERSGGKPSSAIAAKNDWTRTRIFEHAVHNKWAYTLIHCISHEQFFDKFKDREGSPQQR